MEGQSLQSAFVTNETFSEYSRLSISIVLTDPTQDDNPIVYVNDAFERTTGYSRAVSIGRNCRFLQGEKTDKRDVDRMRAALAARREVSVDIVNYRANGTPFFNRLIIAPIFGEDGEPVFFFGLQKELTEKDHGGDNRISGDNLTVVQNLVQRDLAMILTSLREPAISDEMTTRRELESLPRRLETLQLVYEEMRLTGGADGRGKVDLGTLLGRVSSAIAHDEGRAGIRFVQTAERAEITLDHATRIAMIVSETLHNAFNHAFSLQDEGRIELRVTTLSGGGVRIMVSDDGEGLPAGVAWPSEKHAGGRLVRGLLNGLDATLNVVRGAAGTVVLLDVPVNFET
ncbi:MULTISPECIES: PAS domain-containing protein [Roseinatronobacter]|uniref:PAS domain-containing protein n=1 Tax=Roseinatronobacter domitianus TaxID=2940293 RepID=A0ABT0M4N4_9RHOB|nr:MULTISPECIES: PAS domain-containing protein [Roseibaca]MCL1629618.1 PAS domain-containing protein [Roseibaca domitiana]